MAKSKYTDDYLRELLTEASTERLTSSQFRALYTNECRAIDRRFNGMGKACDHFGINRLPRQKGERKLDWTNERVIDGIQRLANSGIPLSSDYLKRSGHRDLVAAAKRRFGTWNDAIIASGHEPYYLAGSSKSKDEFLSLVIMELLSGTEPTHTALSARVRGFSNSMTKLSLTIEDLKQILNICHITIDKPKEVIEKPKRYIPDLQSREGLTFEIKRLYDEGVPLNYTYIKRKKTHLIAASKALFPTWADAVNSSGIDYENIKLDSNIASECGYALEELFGEILTEFGVEYSQYEHEHYDPDFVLPNNEWIDVKLSQYASGHTETVRKYLPHCNSLTLVFLRGDKSCDRTVNGKYRLVNVYKYVEGLPKPKQNYYVRKLAEIEKALA